MQLAGLVNAIEKLSVGLEQSFYDFEKEPNKFNDYAGTQLAYLSGVYQGHNVIKYQSALFYLKYKCRELITRIDTVVFFVHSGNVSLNVHDDDLLEDYHYYKESGKDETISMELEIERLLKDGTSNADMNIKPLGFKTKKRPGPKRNDKCILDTYEFTKLFWFLSETETIPGKGNNIQIAEMEADQTGIGVEYARRNMDDKSGGLTDARKKKIIKQLNATIDAIQASK